MITTFTGGAVKLWLYAGDPDSSVQTETGFFANQGEIFLNTTSKNLFFCQEGGEEQVWVQLAYQT